MSEETNDKKSAPTKKVGKKRKSAKSGGGKKIAIILAGVFVFIGVTGALSFYMGWVHAIMGWEQPQTVAKLELGEPVMHPFPEIRTDLKTGECKSPFLRTTIHVQLFPDDLKTLTKIEMQVHDAILTHLRGQERQHFVGKEGSERLRFELVQVINNQIKPAKIHTVYFKDLLIQ
jgi:flagellar basal body-associated protein FliL